MLMLFVHLYAGGLTVCGAMAFLLNQEVAEAVAFLASSDYITGQVLVIDGGLTTQI